MKEITDQEKRRKILTKIIQDLSKTNKDMYYNSTSDTSNEIKKYIEDKNDLSKNELDLVGDMTARDISLILSINS